MIPHTCKACGHVYGENNAFVRQTGCCPRCGAKVGAVRKGLKPWIGIAVAACLVVVIGMVFFFTSDLLQL